MKSSTPRVGDLVQHKRFKTLYIVTRVDSSNMVGVYQHTENETRYIHKNWLEAFYERR